MTQYISLRASVQQSMEIESKFRDGSYVRMYNTCWSYMRVDGYLIIFAVDVVVTDPWHARRYWISSSSLSTVNQVTGNNIHPCFIDLESVIISVKYVYNWGVVNHWFIALPCKKCERIIIPLDHLCRCSWQSSAIKITLQCLLLIFRHTSINVYITLHFHTYVHTYVHTMSLFFNLPFSSSPSIVLFVLPCVDCHMQHTRNACFDNVDIVLFRRAGIYEEMLLFDSCWSHRYSLFSACLIITK